MNDIAWDDEQSDIVWDDVPKPSDRPESFDVRKHPLHRIGRGTLGTIEGLAQLMSHITPGLDSDSVDQFVKEQQAVDEEAHPGFDPYRMLGTIASPLNLVPATKIPAVIGASKAVKALSPVKQAMVKGLPTGYALSAISPTAKDGDYAENKMGDIATGSIVNALVPAGFSAIRNAAGKLGSIASAITGGGGDSVKLAWQAGKEGGEAAKNLAGHMRQQPGYGAEDLVEGAKTAVTALKSQKTADYLSGMKTLSESKQVIPLTNIEKAVKDSINIKKYEGIDLAPSLDSTRKEILQVVNEWKNLPKDVYHTPSGLDGLKQRIGDIRDRTGTSNVQRAMVDKVYNAITSEIKSRAPVYAKTMSDFQTAHKTIAEIEKSLGVGNTASTDAGVRKLSRALKDSYKEDLVNKLDPHLKYKIAGHNLQHFEPTGIGKMAALSAAGLGLYQRSPSTLAFSLTQMPRVMGEMSLAGGSIDRVATPIVSNALQNLLLQLQLQKRGRR